MKTVFITGASGTMGHATFLEFRKHRDKFSVVLLLRDSMKNRKLFADYINDPLVRIVWGDLTNYADVYKCVTGSDYVLHIGGMVSPAADYYPKKTIATNTAAADNIVSAVKAQDDPDAIKVVYIGTVAETGDRNPPIHWGRTGDPIKISIYDHYAISKVKAERIFAESGLRYWASLRQSGILYPEILKNFDPIMFHVPINGVLEWATVEDSARLMVNCCCDWVPEEFWRGFYNIGSGREYRLTNYEFEELLLGTLGMKDPKKLFRADWFILRNFHGQWYSDSDKLEDMLHFRLNTPVKDYFRHLGNLVPQYYKLAVLAPLRTLRETVMKNLANTHEYGTMNWISTGNRDRISAYYGTRENWQNIGNWKKSPPVRPSEEQKLLDHGYDESKPDSELDLEDMKKAAAFRGGECVSKSMVKGDLFTPLKWRSARGNEFEMTPNLVLKGGHWCPEELPWPWDYDTEARINPFFAQVWYPLHDKDENNVYGEEIFASYPEYKDQ
ncbi:MAG: NAD(P)-dependent oxidoreductase [Clostridia bacterium]|nr:NAD(P)-dependent oxidoreductase [Clostridia bacterium]